MHKSFLPGCISSNSRAQNKYHLKLDGSEFWRMTMEESHTFGLALVPRYGIGAKTAQCRLSKEKKETID